VFGLLGPNGAGKTTTIKMLITLLPATSGSATVAGHDIAHEARAVRRSIGYVPQLLSSDGALSARENLDISGPVPHSRPERRERIDEALRFMGLMDVGDNLVRTYSGGMVRRLEIAQAMLHAPPVLFLDEPTVGLDPTARRAVWEHVRKLRELEGTTILLTTHYMDEAAELCERSGSCISAGSSRWYPRLARRRGRPRCQPGRRVHPLHRQRPGRCISWRYLS